MMREWGTRRGRAASAGGRNRGGHRVQGDRDQGAAGRYHAAAISAWHIVFPLLLLARALTAPIDYDEDQYVAAGLMARHLMLYRDFIYLQPPADPLLLAGLFTLSGGYYFLVARVLTGALATGVFVLTITLLRRYGAGRGLAAALASIVLLSPFLDRPTATARNDILPLALFLAGLVLYLDAPQRARSWLVAAGLCVGLAVEAKISYVFAPLALLLHAAWPRTGRLPHLAPLAAGIALAALPGLYYLAVAHDGFLFDLLEYHMTAPIAWYHREGESGLLNPGHRMAVLAVLLAWGSNASLALLVAGLAAIRVWQGANDATPPAAPPGLLGLLLGLAVLVGFQPSPSWPMYYAPVAPLLAALTVSMFVRTRIAGPPDLVPLLLVIAALPALPPLWARVTDLAGLARPATWPGLEVHFQADALRQTLQTAGLTGDVATLFPVHVLDADPVRAEFASGPFFFRTADLVPEERIARLHGASAGDLETLFAASPPAAILGGFAKGQWSVEMDASLADYALHHGYRPAPLAPAALWPAGTWLYLRGAAAPG
jgi:hypothetical protein